MSDRRPDAVGQLEVLHPPARQQRPGHEHVQEVELTPIGHDTAGRALAELSPCALDRRRVVAREQQDGVRLENQIGRGMPVLVALANDEDAHGTRQTGGDLVHGPANDVGGTDGDLERRQAGTPGLVHRRLHHELHDVHAENRADDAERIRDAVTHHGIAVAGGFERRLHGRRIGTGPGEEPGCERVRHVHRRPHRQGDGAGGKEGKPRQEVVATALGAGEPGNELRAELHAEAVEEHHQAQRADERRRLRGWRHRAKEQAREQHGADAERQALEVDGTECVAARDHEKERQERLLGEEGGEGGHDSISAL